MFDALYSFFSLINNEIVIPIYDALIESYIFPYLSLAIGSFIVFFLNIFREIPIVEIIDSSNNIAIDLSAFTTYDSFSTVIAELVGFLLIIWLFKIFFRFIKFIIDLVLSLVKDLQREIKMHYYLKGKKGGHKQL